MLTGLIQLGSLSCCCCPCLAAQAMVAYAFGNLLKGPETGLVAAALMAIVPGERLRLVCMCMCMHTCTRTLTLGFHLQPGPPPFICCCMTTGIDGGLCLDGLPGLPCSTTMPSGNTCIPMVGNCAGTQLWCLRNLCLPPLQATSPAPSLAPTITRPWPSSRWSPSSTYGSAQVSRCRQGGREEGTHASTQLKCTSSAAKAARL